MNTRHLFLFVITITLLASPDSAAGQPPTCAGADKRFTPFTGDTGRWQVDQNWFPPIPPLATESACIPVGKTAFVEGYVCTGGIGCNPQSDCIPGGACTDRLCVGGTNDGLSCSSGTECPGGVCQGICDGGDFDALPCDPDADCPVGETCEDTLGRDVVVASVVVEATGQLTTQVNASLTIRSDSRVDGTLSCEEPSKLLIDGHVTITGVGGIIRGDWDPNPILGGPVPSRMEGVPGSDQCIGGSNDGAACDPNTECLVGACIDVVCLGGDNNGQRCITHEDCPNGSCADAVCDGGPNEGEVCISGADCPSGTCVDVFCAFSFQIGQSCDPNVGCPGGACVPPTLTIEPGDICVGGSNEGFACTSGADCPGGACSPNDNSDRATSLAIEEVWVIEVGFVNNAYVESDIGYAGSYGRNQPLVLQGDPKSGSGFWVAKKTPEGVGAFEMKEFTHVSGSGTWQMTDSQAAIFIYASANVTNLTGNFEISAGIFDIGADFATTGNLSFGGATLIVRAGNTASFDDIAP